MSACHSRYVTTTLTRHTPPHQQCAAGSHMLLELSAKFVHLPLSRRDRGNWWPQWQNSFNNSWSESRSGSPPKI